MHKRQRLRRPWRQGQMVVVALMALMVVGCGSDPSGNSNTNSNADADVGCAQHGDCADSQICDPGTSTCVENTCGDGVVRGDEQCDGEALGEATCDGAAGLPSGDMVCSNTCELDAGGCYDCGDGQLIGPEACDGANLDGASCTGNGYDGGTLACQSDCLAPDESACTTCGDGVCDLDNGERTDNCPADCGWVQIDIGGGGMYGMTHTCGVKGDGSVWCWGINDHGQLGDGTYDATSVPVQVVMMEDAVSVTVGGAHTCALKEDQTAWCWGHNLVGQLGDGTYMDSTIPTEVLSSRPVLSVDANSRRTTCAVTQDLTRRQATCWGVGRLGVIVTSPNSPVPLSIEPAFRYVAAGITHSCALSDTGATAYCWGDNAEGQLGDGETTASLIPVMVAPPTSIDASAIQPADVYTCALITDGTVSCWGHGMSGVLGNSLTYSSLVPIPVEGLSTTSITQLSGDDFEQCALGQDQLVYCWGLNHKGQLGDGTTAIRSPPRAMPVTNLSGAVYVDAGFVNACAITQDGQAYCWGSNDDGQLGIGPAAIGTDTPTPTLVIDPYE